MTDPTMNPTAITRRQALKSLAVATAAPAIVGGYATAEPSDPTPIVPGPAEDLETRAARWAWEFIESLPDQRELNEAFSLPEGWPRLLRGGLPFTISWMPARAWASADEHDERTLPWSQIVFTSLDYRGQRGIGVLVYDGDWLLADMAVWERHANPLPRLLFGLPVYPA